MEQHIFIIKVQSLYVGVDYHKKYSIAKRMDEEGTILRQTSFCYYSFIKETACLSRTEIGFMFNRGFGMSVELFICEADERQRNQEGVEELLGTHKIVCV